MEESKAFLEKADKLLAAITVNGENVILLCDARRLIAEAYKKISDECLQKEKENKENKEADGDGAAV